MKSPQEYEALIRQLNTQLNEQRATLHRIYSSRSWKLTQPFRKLDGLVRNRLLGSTPIELIPANQIEKLPEKHKWASLGEDPQFLLRPRNPAVMRRNGWGTLTFFMDCDHPVTIQLFIDTGKGYESDLAITFSIKKPGHQSVPLYLPRSFIGLRLDPATTACHFTIRDVVLKRKKSPREPAPEHQPILSYLASLDAINCQLIPVHQISRNLQDNFHWTAHGDDPHFLLEFDGQNRLDAGWYQVDLLQSKGKRRGMAKLYFDTGANFNEAESLNLPFVSGAPTQRVFLAQEPALRVRFDPKETEGHFRVDSLAITPLTIQQARQAMAMRLAAREKKPPKEILNTIAADCAINGMDPQTALASAYNATFEDRADTMAYGQWIQEVEAASLPSEETVRASLASMGDKPLISIIVPVYNTPAVHLKACIDSVLAQSYPHWELCIADDASPKSHVRQVLDAYQKQDTRIKVVYRPQNGHISRASNSALELATGDFVALLDHDDALPKHALYHVAQAVHEYPEAKIFYSDEDKLDANGQRFDPHFKSDWNPDLFYSQNYVSHLGVYQRALLNRIQGFRPGVEGSQDQDLLLRCLPHVEGDHIVHIPRVLYHWRTVEGSTALASGEKSYTTDAGIKALRDYFDDNGPEGTSVEAGQLPNTYRVRWPVPKPEPLVSLLIPTRDRRTITEVAVRSILEKTTYTNYEIIILDNGSLERETLAFFEEIQQEDARVRVIRYDHPFNYSAINNFGVRHAAGSIIGLINNDVEVISPDWLTEMVSHAVRPEIGCVGAKLYYSNDTLQHGGVILGIGGVAGHSHKYLKRDSAGYFSRMKITQATSAVTAACLLIRREIYNKVNGLEENHLKIAFNDVDFCLKVVEAGYRNLWTPYAELYHHESISRGTEDTPEKQQRFAMEVGYMHDRWGERLKSDPYYSPNLTRDREDFSI